MVVIVMVIVIRMMTELIEVVVMVTLYRDCVVTFLEIIIFHFADNNTSNVPCSRLFVYYTVKAEDLSFLDEIVQC